MAELTEAEAIARAEATVRSYCGWHIAPSKDETLTLDGPGTGVLLLPSLHVTAIGSITENGTVVDPGAYQWSATGVVRRTADGGAWSVSSQTRWTSTLRGLEVALTHGYTEMPLDVQAIIERLTERLLESSSALTAVGAVQYATGPDGTPLGGTPGLAETSVLALYKLPHRP